MADEYKGADGTYDVSKIISGLDKHDRYGNDTHINWNTLIDNGAAQTEDADTFKDALFRVQAPEEIEQLEQEYGVNVTGKRSAKELYKDIVKARGNMDLGPAKQPDAKTEERSYVENSIKSVAEAKPGDWIKRNNGEEVQLTQYDIAWAKNRLKASESQPGDKPVQKETPDAMKGDPRYQPKENSETKPDMTLGEYAEKAGEDAALKFDINKVGEEQPKPVTQNTSAMMAQQMGQGTAVTQGATKDSPKQIPYTVTALAKQARPGDYVIQPNGNMYTVDEQMIRAAQAKLSRGN